MDEQPTIIEEGTVFTRRVVCARRACGARTLDPWGKVGDHFFCSETCWILDRQEQKEMA